MLEAFFRDLDATVGRDNYIAVLTADHGFMPAAEVLQQRGEKSGRLSISGLLAKVNADLERRFGVAKLVAFSSASALVLDRKLVAARGLDANTVAEAARTLLASEPAIAAAYTRRELETGSRAGAPFFDPMRRSWNRDISGDVQYAYAPGWMATSTSSIATHGSPHPYDTHVPILFWGPKWVQAGQRTQRVEVVDIAPTLAQVLGVAAPSGNEGRALPLAR
jgi:arylsulfatase A-like enzyme